MLYMKTSRNEQNILHSRTPKQNEKNHSGNVQGRMLYSVFPSNRIESNA